MNNDLICIIITLIKIYIHKKAKKKYIITHYPRTDRSGSFLLIDLFFYAYSKKWNYEFKINKDYNKRKEISNPNILYNFLGWKNIINDVNKKDNFINLDNNFNNKCRDNNYIITNDSKEFENIMIKSCGFNEYFDKSLRQELYKNFKSINYCLPEYFKNKKLTNIAIHIRRGDIDKKYFSHAYFENKIFINLIKKFHQKYKDCNIHVFSCERNVEGWNDFKKLNCKLHLRKNWSNDQLKYEKIDMHHFIEADILVIGGTFSYFPAFLNKNKIYYPEMYWHCPLNHWQIYDKYGNIK